MGAVFIKLLNMSITAGWLVLAVVLLRFLLKKAPKWMMVVLWGFVAFRLIFPFSFESVCSLIPSVETIPQNILISENPAINSGFEVLNKTVNPIIAEIITPNVSDSVNPIQIITFIASVIWIIGTIAMCIYTVVSYVRVRKKVEEAVQLKENIWMCDHIPTPFILGIFCPRIYVPSSMNETNMKYVIFHEKAHLKRKDHIWKPLGFLLLSVYWFNPVLWLAYILLCRDIELACDEKVIRQFGTEIKKPYSDALINCSVPRKVISVCPLAFGETGVKERVKGVLSYKKPAFWIILMAVIACIITGICLLTNPKNEIKEIFGYTYSISKYYDYTKVINRKKADAIAADQLYVVDEKFGLYFYNGDDWSFEGTLKDQSVSKDIEKMLKAALPLHDAITGFDEIYITEGNDIYALTVMKNNDIFIAYIADYQDEQQKRITAVQKLKYDKAITEDDFSSVMSSSVDAPNSVIINPSGVFITVQEALQFYPYEIVN